ncbi:hypothetical protein [Streptomyces avidinii]
MENWVRSAGTTGEQSAHFHASQQVWYQVRLSDLLIDGLTDAPAE